MSPHNYQVFAFGSDQPKGCLDLYEQSEMMCEGGSPRRLRKTISQQILEALSECVQHISLKTDISTRSVIPQCHKLSVCHIHFTPIAEMQLHLRIQQGTAPHSSKELDPALIEAMRNILHTLRNSEHLQLPLERKARPNSLLPCALGSHLCLCQVSAKHQSD